ncbi:MAG: M1 family metallopeptidase [Flavobacteriales bacterium]
MRRILSLCLLALPVALPAQLGAHPKGFTHADTLRGSIGPERAWWDVTQYDVTVRPDYKTKSIVGTTIIAFDAITAGQRMQIDLQQPLVVDSATTEVSVYKDGAFKVEDRAVKLDHVDNVLWVDLPFAMKEGEASTITIRYHGVPRAAKRPPWDGGWVWKKDAHGNPWMSVACQGLGASVWYPCKDHQSDEPERASLHITVPDTLQAIGNGRLRSVVKNGDGTSTWNWMVDNPINTYNLVPSIGKYTHFSEVYSGASGPLDCDYWVLADNEAKAREQFKQVPPMLKCFEDWFGPYPFYNDGYKLVESPYLGMEHQSAIAYGNGYQNGHMGSDRSGTGWGLKWDYIIIHETAHEWFANSITTADVADMWIHEGFADYAETIYTQCQYGDTAGNDYVIGLRKSISNDRPLIGPYGVNEEGSSDMYNKGSNLLHTIRHILANDSLFKAMLREMNHRFYHRITTSAEVEAFISSFSGRDLSRVFDQYLRTTQIPELEWGIRKKQLWVRYSNCLPDFAMPVDLMINGTTQRMDAHGYWLRVPGKYPKKTTLAVDRNWYVGVEQVAQGDVPVRQP